MKDKITIIGCGNVGTCLSYTILLSTLENKINIKTLTILDPDIIEEHNFPYGITMMNHREYKHYIGYPKGFLIVEELIDINEKIQVGTFAEIYSEIYKKKDNEFIIDCRDSNSQIESSDIKLSCDGNYGKIIVNPKNKKGEPKNYTFYRSKFSSLFLSCFCVNIITKMLQGEIYQDKEEKTIVYEL